MNTVTTVVTGLSSGQRMRPPKKNAGGTSRVLKYPLLDLMNVFVLLIHSMELDCAPMGACHQFKLNILLEEHCF